MPGSALRKGRVASAPIVLALGLASCPVHAQSVLPGLPDVDGTVTALSVAGNTVFVGGSFSLLGDCTGAGVVVDATTGAAADDSPVLKSIELPPGGVVFAVASDGADGWFVGGIFSSVGGQARQNLAHIAADRTVTAWNPGANAPVRALLRSGTTLYVGGDFTQTGGQSRARLAALHTTTAAVQAWNPGVNANGIVQAFALSDTTLYVGGDFSMIGGQPRTDIAAVGTGVGAATPWAPAITGAWVETIALDGGLAYIGGVFTDVGGSARSNAAAINLSTGAVTAWSPDANSAVHALAVTANEVFAGGDFGTIGGRARIGIARLNKTSGAATASWNANCDGAVYALEVLDDTLRVGGTFTTLGGQSRANVAELVASTAVAAGWAPSVNDRVHCVQTSGTQTFLGGRFRYSDVVRRNNLAAVDMTTLEVMGFNPNPNGGLRALATDGVTLYAGGSFNTIGAQTRGALAAFNVVPGTLLPFDAHINQGSAVIPTVDALLLDDGVLRLSGNINSLGITARSYAGAVDAVTGAALPWAPEPNSRVYAIADAPSGVFLAGTFSTVGGLSRPLLAEVDPTSGVPTAWQPPAFIGGYRLGGTYQNPWLTAIDERDGELFVGGSFSNVGGVSRGNAASLDAASAAVLPWTPPGDWIPDLWAGVWAFETTFAPVFMASTNLSVNGLLKLDPTTGAADPWPPSVQSVRALARWGPYLLLGGDFQTVGTETATGLAALSDPSVVDVPLAGRGVPDLAFAAPAPNPTRGPAHLVLSLPAPAEVSVHVLDLAGRRVHTVLSRRRVDAGHHTIRLDLSRHAPGVYLVEAVAGGHRATRKVVISR